VIRAEQIPDEVVEAYFNALKNSGTKSIRECFAAALNAWPDAELDAYPDMPHIILPLEGRVIEYGSISGKLETVSERNGFRFVIYDDLWDRPINCLVKEEDKARVMGVFGKRVEVFGDIRYRSDGRATSVDIEDFTEFPDPDALPKTADVKGILRNYRRTPAGR